jgi:diguanylate cyclase (GGDEF)-like protein
MHYIILKPIHTLRKQMHWIIENEEFQPIANISKSNDEFSDLTRHFNSLIEHVQEQNKALADLSLTDPLTQLQNRRSLDQFIDTLGGFLQREKKHLSVIMIDIDHFKLYNDSYGHLQGDEIISKVAQVILQYSNRSSDFVARYGGEEFVIILPNTELESAKVIAGNIRSEVASLLLPHKASTTTAYVTISVGLSSGLLEDKNQIVRLLEEADDALYDAKSHGRNRVAVYKLGNLPTK